jgi:voltage-gated potassium channel Kch
MRPDDSGRRMNAANGRGVSSLEAALTDVEQRGGMAWDVTLNLAATTARAAAKAPTAAIVIHGAVRGGYVIGFGITTSDKDVVRSLTADGWVVNFEQPDRVGLGKKWVVRSSADRLVLMQDVNGALARLGPPGDHQFRWQALGTDPGLGQASMCFTFLSAPIGAIVGLVVLVVTGVTAFPAALGAAIAGAVVGWVSGLFLAQAGLRLTLPIRRYRHHAEEVALAFAVVGPPIVALAVTILAGMNFQTT